jgi:cytochrome P450
MSARPEEFGHHGEDLDSIFSTYQELRSACPVGRSERYGGFWSLTRYADIWAAEQNPEAFSVDRGMLLPSLGNERPLIPLDIDPPTLQQYRRMLLPAFAPGKIDRLEPLVREVAAGLIEAFAGEEVFDASLSYARILPLTVFAEMAGLPRADYDRFQVWIERTMYGRTEDPADAVEAAKEVDAYFRELRRRRLEEPERDDLIGNLLSGSVDGRALSEDEFADYCFLLLVAGLETSAWSIRSALWYLAQHPEDRRRLVAQPELMVSATEEFLRCLAPVQGMARTLKSDVEVRGQVLPAGERVLLLLGSGNRDEEVFADADEVVIDRVDNPHLAFGIGAHRCLGSNLGRREVRVGLEALLAQVPEFELADPEVPWWGLGPLPLRRLGDPATRAGGATASRARRSDDEATAER